MSGTRSPDRWLGLLARVWPIITVAAAMIWMFYIRVRTYGNFLVDGRVYFSGNDAWYHLRQVEYLVANFPQRMPFDPWTGYPVGRFASQFGTLYDQLVAAAALVIGLGSPTEQQVAITLLVAPAVFGTLVAVPTYLIGRELGGRTVGAVAVIILALLPGTFLRRGLVGFADHNIVEPLFMLVAVWLLMVSVRVSNRADLDLDAVRQVRWSELLSPLRWGALAGVATVLYLWVWPPGVILLGIVAIAAVLQGVTDIRVGRADLRRLVPLGTAMVVVALFMLLRLTSPGYYAQGFTILAPLLALGVLAGAAVITAGQYVRVREGLPPLVVVLGLGVLAAVALVLLSVIAPGVYQTLTGNFLNIVGFGTGATTRTIGEAQPFLRGGSVAPIIREYGLMFFIAAGAVIWMLAAPLLRSGAPRELGFAAGGLAVTGIILALPVVPAAIGGVVGIPGALIGFAIVAVLFIAGVGLADHPPERLMFLAWVAIITAATFTQVRFNYYLAPGVAILAALLLVKVARSSLLGLTELDSIRDLTGYQLLTIGAVLLLVLAPVLAVPITVGGATTQTAFDASANNGPGSVVIWDESLSWLATETPVPGTLGGEEKADELPYLGTFEYAEDFAYPDGSYGVMSWWDYGHWITLLGERIPHANPFQQHATQAANFLLAGSEEASIAAVAEQSTEGAGTRYVMIDWQMATPGSKFTAPTVWYDAEEDIDTSSFLRPVYRFDESGQIIGAAQLRTDRFYDATMTRLYYYHGSAVDPAPVVTDWEEVEAETAAGPITVDAAANESAPLVRQFETMADAEAYLANDSTAQLGGVGTLPIERVPALTEYRLVHVSETSAAAQIQGTTSRNARAIGLNPAVNVPASASWVKTFERVPGATVRGSGAPAGTEVTASVELAIPQTNGSFTYIQHAEADDEGRFSLQLPYATTGYDAYGPAEGYTNVSVRATGPYTVTAPPQFDGSGLTTYRAELAVDEGAVNGAAPRTLTVTLSEDTSAITPADSD